MAYETPAKYWDDLPVESVGPIPPKYEYRHLAIPAMSSEYNLLGTKKTRARACHIRPTRKLSYLRASSEGPSLMSRAKLCGSVLD